jgi:hypothetical protein
MQDALADGLVEGSGGILEARLRSRRITGPEGRSDRSNEMAYASLDRLIALAARQALSMSLQGRWVICHEGG